jgi:nucleotide-binding universal stress UspA family protein
MLEMKRILFPIDLAEDSSKIFPYVLSMANKYNSTIYLVYAIRDVYQWAPGYISHPSADVLRRQAQEDSEKVMNRYCEEQLGGHLNCQRSIVLGDPVDEILKVIESEDIDLVVMGTHGRKGVSHAIFGSVAENVIKSSPVPVLIVNPKNVK